MADEDAADAIFPLPAYAYVPGETQRHPHGAFEALCATVRQGDDPEALARSGAWQCGLRWLEHGYFWEAHELFEPVWLTLPQNAAERQLVQALIQIANAGLKAKMGRRRAVERLLAMAEGHLRACKSGGTERLMGQSLDKIAARIELMRAAQG